MDKESKSTPSQLSGNGIIAVVLLAAGVLFVRETPLETTRLPVNEPRLEQRFAPQDIDARLWQDPFGAIARARAQAPKKQPDPVDAQDRQRRSYKKLVADIESRMAARTEEDLQRRQAANPAGAIERRPQRVEILAVMLPSGPHSENVESRRRARYAVLAGLNASRLAPADTEHLGYFLPRASLDATDTPPAPEAFAATVPFEWFEPAADVSQGDTGALDPLVLVMWLPSEAFGARPLGRMKDLALQFKLPGVSWRVLGPNASDGLKAMIEEAAKPGFTERVAMSQLPLRFYSPNATVPDSVLLADRVDPGSSLSLADYFERKGVKLVRTIGDDASLADSLIDELALRGLTPLELKPGPDRGDDETAIYKKTCNRPRDADHAPPSHIAVVAEWDTLYGRSLRREFRATLKERGFCVKRFHYVRGLDGQLPASGDGASASASAGSAKPVQADKDAGRRKDGTFIEMAEGQSQFDYLRRLAAQMRAQDLHIRQSSADGRGLRAIGVLGNDVHDKLLVLQALQPEFPNAIFFTTDMDARFLHPREQAWTRNLIVASSFGLRLTEGLQGGAPPFRASYQTSAFLATRLAMEDARRASQPAAPAESTKTSPLSQRQIARWLATPRIFEIGRTAAFDFKGSVADESLRSNCRGPGWIQCEDIHPSGSRRYPTPGRAILAWTFSLVVFALWAPAVVVSRGARRALSLFFAPRPTLGSLARYGGLALLLALVQLVLPLWMADHWDSLAHWLTRGKPLVAFEGISLWPTQALRLFTLLLCIHLLYRGWLMLSYNLDDISEKFRSGTTRSELMAKQREADKNLHWWQRLAQMFSLGFVASPKPAPAAAHGMQALALDFWNRHIVQNRLSARFVRTGLCVALAVLLSCLLMTAAGDLRFVPQRGDRSLAVHEWLRLPALAMMYFLVFFVVDATVYCVCFVRGLRGLRENEANWPDSTLNLFAWQLGIPKTQLDNWIDLQFIALRTRCVTRLIYYPFIVISLWLLSKSPTLDHWTMTISTVVPAAMGAALALGCAVALRLSAEKSRKHALDQVKDAVMRANAKIPANAAAVERPSVEQLKLLQSRIENLHEGAFAPFWQQPLLKALLLPFATLGGTTLLDYMALANL